MEWLARVLPTRRVRTESEDNAARVRRILDLYERTKNRIVLETHSQYAITLLDAIFRQPVFTATMLVSTYEMERPTAAQLLRRMKEAGLLTEIREARGQRPAVLCFPELLKITEA